MRTPPFLFSGEKLLYQRRESSSYFLEIEGIFQLCPRKYFTHTVDQAKNGKVRPWREKKFANIGLLGIITCIKI